MAALKNEKAEKAEKKEKKKKAKAKAAKLVAEAVEAVESPHVSPLSHDESMAAVMARIGGKWKIRVLWAMADDTLMRYSEIKRRVEGITDVMLSQSLREMTEDGLLIREQKEGLPLRVDYGLTDKSRRLIPVLAQLVEWGKSL